MDNEPLTADAKTGSFSLVQGVPLYQLSLRAKLTLPTMELLNRRIVAYVALAWLPLVVLTLLAGTFASGVNVPFLYDLSNARVLISLPLLIGAELIVHRRLRGVVQAFLERELIAPEDQPKFEAMIIRAMRLRNAVVAEVLLFLLSFTGGYWLWRTYVRHTSCLHLVCRRRGRRDSFERGGVLARVRQPADRPIHPLALVLPPVHLVLVLVACFAPATAAQPIAPRPRGRIGVLGTHSGSILAGADRSKRFPGRDDRQPDLARRGQAARFQV